MKASDLRPGMAVTFDNKLYVCVQSTHVTPGNLRAFVQAKLKCIADGTIIDKRLRTTEDIEQAYLDRREMEYLYPESTGHVLMDIQTFDQPVVSEDMIGDSVKYLKPNTKLTALLCGGNIVAIELPKIVELEVTETAPTMKDATKTNQMKEAVMETGLKTRVPPFINVGEIVRISTEDGSYLARAKSN
ncbi:MAG: elongation factor P [Candidatus Brocadiia bacterium]|nr:MAG: elongation factor P [Candidatus Brocadiia bacterium]